MAAGITAVVCDTRAERSLAATGYGERRAQCEQGVAALRRFDPGIRALRDVSPAFLAAHEAALPAMVARRCRFIVEEGRRVLELAATLPTGDRGRLTGLLEASWRGANELYEMGAPSMTAMHEAMSSAPGLIARRQAGGGFGGCLVALVERDAVAAFEVRVAAAYHEATGIEPRIFAVRPSPGASRLEIGD
jgi:galactokinase